MKFNLEKHSSIPVQAQIKERIKIALTLGELRPGDTLPSIRDLEEDLGVGRAIIRSAYLDLKRSGVLIMKRGRRVYVNDILNHRTDKELLATIEGLVDQTLKEVSKLNVSNACFAKFLLHKARQKDRKEISYLFADHSRALAWANAQQISELWEISIQAISIHELPDLLRSRERSIYKILVIYYRFNEVNEIVKGYRRTTRVDVIPVGLRFTEQMIREIEALPRRSRVLLIAEDKDFEKHGHIFDAAYREAFAHRLLEFVGRKASDVKNLAELVRSGKYRLIIVSNRLWDNFPPPLKKMRRITHPRLEVDRTSLEEARIRAGIIV